MKFKNSIFFVGCLAMWIIFSQCSNSSKLNIADQSTMQIYSNNCASCHGQQLQQFKILKTYEKLDIDGISMKIKAGNMDQGMPAFGELLEDSIINALSVLIKEFDYTDNQIVEKSESKDYDIEVIVDSLDIIWGMEFLSNGEMLLAEKNGTLSRRTSDGKLFPIANMPKVRNKGQGGLLDLKLHPDYEDNGWLYISYSYIDEEDENLGNTRIIRAQINNDALENIEEIYRGIPAVRTNHHFGNRMVFDREGYLYLSNGDRGRRDEFPQKLDNSNGKIHRLKDDGSIPKDNPFAGDEGVIQSIYSFGHRNPQGLAMHPETGQIWEHEHGPKGGDEINIIEKGLNYGWPVISYGINYSGTKFTEITEKEGMEQPIHYYVPSIAPCGMAFIESDIYPDWKNDLLIGSLSFRYLERLTLNGNQVINQEKMLEELDSRVRDVRIGPDGYIYVSVEGPGRILKIIPKKAM